MTITAGRFRGFRRNMTNAEEKIIRSQIRMIGKLSSLLKHYGKPEWEDPDDEVAILLRKARKNNVKARKFVKDYY